MSMVKLDSKGRVVIKRKVLLKAGVRPPCTMLAYPKSAGVIELKEIGMDLSRASRIASRKLKGWREEEHRGEKLLSRMTQSASD